MIVGGPGGGKSWALVAIGAQAVRLGYTVIHYTSELGERYVGKRYDANLTEIPVGELQDRKEEVEERPSYLKKRQRASTPPIPERQRTSTPPIPETKKKSKYWREEVEEEIEESNLEDIQKEAENKIKINIPKESEYDKKEIITMLLKANVIIPEGFELDSPKDREIKCHFLWGCRNVKQGNNISRLYI